MITFRVLGKEQIRLQIELGGPVLALSPKAIRNLPIALILVIGYISERSSRVVGNDPLALRILGEKLTPGVLVIPFTVPGNSGIGQELCFTAFVFALCWESLYV